MADEKKKSAPVAPARTNFEEIIFLLAGLLILAVIINRIVSYLDSLGLNAGGLFELLRAYLGPFWSVWKVIAVVISAASVAWAICNKRKLGAINKEENKIYNSLSEESLLEELTEKNTKDKGNEKWLKVTEHVNSENPSDWRLAIIEADVMLEELLRNLNYHGDSVGEMLKSVDKSDFLSLESAWEAHKIRNSIAHEGGNFQLNEREARRAITLFEKVFREFGIV
ncbi:MAG: hypothetical protein AAB641_02315 [Patescibacteria group bacterium]